MENADLELGNMIQESVQRLLYTVKNDDNDASRISPSIYMAPGTLRDLSPSSFNPKVVSIGPLHIEDENVQAFEKRKAAYLMSLASFINSPQEEILHSCMEKAYASMNEIKASYVWTKTYGDAEIAEMMVMDACFILGFTLKFLLEITVNGSESLESCSLLNINVMHDMMLLENQIPMFFLDKIFQCTILKFAPSWSLFDLIRPVLIISCLFQQNLNTENISINTTQHILDLLHECYAPQDSTDCKLASTSIAHSAVNLHMAGVNFKPNQNPTHPMQMKVETHMFPCFFGSWRNLSFRMPVLKVHDFTESRLRNLIAYEQSFQTRETHHYVTSYAYAMDMLVNTQEDVAKLVDAKVLENEMGSNEEAANMINNVCKNTICNEFFYAEEWKTLDKYCNRYWPKHIAKMRSTYFSSPWSMIALIAGIMLFALTAIQTIFTIKSA